MITVYKYRAYPPIAGLELFETQAKLRHRFQNTLIEIERAWWGLETKVKKDPEAKARKKILLKAARQDAATQGLKWGSYNATIDDAKRAVDSVIRLLKDIKTGARTKPKRDINGPNFKRWDGSGRITVQQQNESRPVVRVLPDSITLQIGSKTELVTVPATVHRSLPSDARIKLASLYRSKVADKFEWHVTITFETADPKPTTNTGMAGVDIGWSGRGADDGKRVACVRLPNGKSYDVRCPESVLNKIRHARGIESLRREKFNVAIAWVKGHFKGVADVPEWMSQALKAAHLWRSEARLASLVLRWRDRRFEGDAAIYETMEVWRKRDKHLWTWQVYEERKALRQRAEVYKVNAALIAGHVGTVKIENVNLSKMAISDDLTKTAQSNRVMVAPSLFLTALANACKTRGVAFQKVKASNTTRTCEKCGVVSGKIKGDYFICLDCGYQEDRDVNASGNIARAVPIVTEVRSSKSKAFRKAGKLAFDTARKTVKETSNNV